MRQVIKQLLNTVQVLVVDPIKNKTVGCIKADLTLITIGL